MGYHIDKIARGTVGQSSKIMEECLELIDAEKQGNRIMALAELSDLYGAMVLYLEEHFPEMGMEDLDIMARATRRAFEDGSRHPRD